MQKLFSTRGCLISRMVVFEPDAKSSVQHCKHLLIQQFSVIHLPADPIPAYLSPPVNFFWREPCITFSGTQLFRALCWFELDKNSVLIRDLQRHFTTLSRRCWFCGKSFSCWVDERPVCSCGHVCLKNMYTRAPVAQLDRARLS